MAYVTKSIAHENRSTKVNFSAVLPELKKLHKFNTIKLPLPHINSRIFNLRHSSLLEKPKNPVLNDLEYKRKCKNLWTSFDNRISPILKKYKFEDLPKKKIPAHKETLDKNSKFIDKNKHDKRVKEYYDSGDPIDFGIQCEITSNSSENENRVNVSRYVHYINIGDCFSN